MRAICVVVVATLFAAPTEAQPKDATDGRAIRPTAPIVVHAGATSIPLDRLRFATAEQHVYRLLLGDVRVLPFIENADVSIVPVLEAALKHVTGVSMDEVDSLVKQLSTADWTGREHASWRLLGAPSDANELLERYLAETGSPEVRHRLASVLAVREASPAGFEAAARLLRDKYRQYAGSLFEQRWRQLQADPFDIDALNFFSYAPFEGIWPHMTELQPGDQLRFLLLRVYAQQWGPDARDEMRKHPAGAVIRIAQQTYWPVEIEPVQRDGDYGWTTLAGSTEGNAANHVLRLSMKTVDFPKPTERGEWVNLVTWARWTYIFRFTQMWHNKNAVVFAERRAASPLPFGIGDTPPMQGQADTVRGWPEGVTVPFVDITERESTDWHHMRAYEWARSLFPESIREQVRFKANAHDVPRVIAADEFEVKVDDPAP